LADFIGAYNDTKREDCPGAGLTYSGQSPESLRAG
jgi:hypothetical protein